ncbi:PUA-like domain-containing protein [Syncephalis pseudoplumigaleata]|uniref:Thymocyte nuclear protein 1 n=1 Tax=Syncephalis pseudoplumigaleata TaxID=1712513 RepID=A0A4P9YZS4_9FUNG|nr:PUA-like domain-containing protein [Syncephalis pseudoplumigaleata]|eukprot:RKP25508.1 PUA-like domain-containing protein [Syncephalis pseudoplumigaleata]
MAATYWFHDEAASWMPERLGPLPEHERIRVYLIGREALEYHITGTLLESLPRQPMQNLVHGLPLQLMAEEVALLLELATPAVPWHREAPGVNAYDTWADARQAAVWSFPDTALEWSCFHVYRDLWRRGWWLGSGLKFGGHYLVYPDNPRQCHSTYVATVSLPREQYTFTHLVRLGRLGTTNYWLMKAEPESRIVKGKDVKFSIDDLAAMPNATSCWDGVRNYEARNIMRDRMHIGDRVLFYHSNCKQPGIAGVAEVVREGYPDHTALDATHPYHDPKLKPGDENRWFMVDVKLVAKYPRLVTLEELKRYKTTHLSEMVLLNRGRLSVQPVTRDEYAFIHALAHSDEAHVHADVE